MRSEEHVLFLSYDGLTDPLGQSQILPYVRGLSGKGYRFTIISFEKNVNYQKNHHAVAALCKAANVRWINLKYHKSPPVLSTLFDLAVMWREALKWRTTNPSGIMHARSYLAALIALQLKM